MATPATESGQDSNAQETITPGLPPEIALTQILLGSLTAQAVFVAAKLGVADSLTGGPKPVSRIAEEVGANDAALYRLLRALASIGVFSEESDRVFGLTPTAELLRSDVPGSLRGVAIFMGEDWHWNVWGQTLYSVKTGEEAWSQVHGNRVFPFFQENPEAARIFDNAMTSFSTLAVKAVLEAYDFSGLNTLVDVAGGHGKLLISILEATPGLRGVLFDLPHVIVRAKQGEDIQKLSSRCELQGGDFFKSVPAGADGYIMKYIIHDWQDEEAIKILSNIKEAMNDLGRVLLVESVVRERNEPDLAKILDIEMLVSPGGKERTAKEYADLFRASGLRLSRIIPTRSPYSIIEAVKA